MTQTQLIKTPLSIKEAKSTYYPMWKHHHSDKIEVADQHPMTGTPEAVKEEFMQWALGWMDKVHDENGIANYDNLKALWRSGEGFKNFEENAYTYSYAQAWSLLTARQKAELAPAIYWLPCSLTGLDANVDNCCPPAIIEMVEADDPMSAGCVDRYITSDGQLIDCSIDSSDFADWFEEELEEFEVEA